MYIIYIQNTYVWIEVVVQITVCSLLRSGLLYIAASFAKYDITPLAYFCIKRFKVS